MGREIKRVALDFDWELGKTWKGFLNPYYKECPEKDKTCFGGITAGRKWFEEIIRFLMVAAEDAANPDRRGVYPHPYLQEFPLAVTKRTFGGYKTIPPTRELAELVIGLGARDTKRDPFGYCSSDNWIVQKKIMEAAGISSEEKWGYCPICKGECIDPAVQEAYEAWTETPPPKGEGWQVWETVSEGSPVTPVFATAEELIEFLVNEGNKWDGPISREAAEKFVKGSGWVPSMVIADGKMYKGIESAVTFKDKEE